MKSKLRMRIEGECYFNMPPAALLKVVSFALYKHVCITFQPTYVPCTTATSGLLYQLQKIGEIDRGAIGGKKIGRENRSTRRKTAPAPLCPLDQTRDRTRAAAKGSQRLTA